MWSIFKGTEKDRPGVAVALILTALLFLSLQDGLVKFIAPETSLWQFQTLRSLANLALIMVGIVASSSWELIRPRNPLAVFFRTCAIVATMVFFFSGAPFLTLPEMGAGLYTYPVFMTILAAIFLRERIGYWRLLAILIAGSGAVVMIQPTSNSFHSAQLLPVAAGFFYSVNATILRKFCRNDSPVTLAFWAAIGFLSASITGVVALNALPISPDAAQDWPFLLRAWPEVTPYLVGFACVCAFCNVTGNVLIVKGYQSAELSGLAPIDYSYLIMATFWGFVLFDGLPQANTVWGMALIATAGILTAWRQSRIEKTTRPTSLTDHF